MSFQSQNYMNNKQFLLENLSDSSLGLLFRVVISLKTDPVTSVSAFIPRWRLTKMYIVISGCKLG